MKKSFVSALCISAIALLVAVNVFAAPPRALRGEYHVVGTRSCVFATGLTIHGSHFGPNFSLPSLGGTTRTGHFEGTLRLNGDGTGDFDFNFIQYYFQATSASDLPIGAFPGSCMVRYESLPNRLISLTFTQCVATGTAGAGLDTTWTSDNEVLTVAATIDGSVLVMSHIGPDVETTSLYVNPDITMERICSRTFTGVRQSIR